jgi:hypothetical protein
LNERDVSPVTVYTAVGLDEANIVKGLLASNGIRCMTLSRAASSVHMFTVDGLGEIAIQVAPEDAGDAMRLIAAESDLPDDSPEEDNNK